MGLQLSATFFTGSAGGSPAERVSANQATVPHLVASL